MLVKLEFCQNLVFDLGIHLITIGGKHAWTEQKSNHTWERGARRRTCGIFPLHYCFALTDWRKRKDRNDKIGKQELAAKRSIADRSPTFLDIMYVKLT